MTTAPHFMITSKQIIENKIMYGESMLKTTYSPDYPATFQNDFRIKCYLSLSFPPHYDTKVRKRHDKPIIGVNQPMT